MYLYGWKPTIDKKHTGKLAPPMLFLWYWLIIISVITYIGYLQYLRMHFFLYFLEELNKLCLNFFFYDYLGSISIQTLYIIIDNTICLR